MREYYQHFEEPDLQYCCFAELAATHAATLATAAMVREETAVSRDMLILIPAYANDI
jgi:hypothetical protein